MSGPLINRPESRRAFLKKSLLATGGLALMGISCSTGKSKAGYPVIPGSILGGNSTTGHLLREGKFNAPVEIIQKEFVIIGGGISGLSAARWLKKTGADNFLLLELDKSTGGNTANGSNAVSAYPWGAHYLPIPDTSMTELCDFLREENVILSPVENTSPPTYNEDYLCFDPQERLFINGFWQEGLVPEYGVPPHDTDQIKKFFRLMDGFREAKGKDGKYAFAIPVDHSSVDETFTRFDQISMSDYLKSEGLNSEYLHWYVNYSCCDDYGSRVQDTSAWAGIHYYCSRRGIASNAEPNAVLTWPEGNGWLSNRLKKSSEQHTLTNSLVYSVSMKGSQVEVDYYDVTTQTTKRILANKVIMACPQFITHRILKDQGERNEDTYISFSYAPWMVANITVKDLPREQGAPLSWDNVFYGHASLGYVNANQQHRETYPDKNVLTYYLPLVTDDPAAERRKAFSKTHRDWVKLILDDLSLVHQEIVPQIEHIDIWLWGHGMNRPVPGMIWGEARKQARMPVHDKIYFAHSDLSGISIFEDAFYQGIKAAKQLIESKSTA